MTILLRFSLWFSIYILAVSGAALNTFKAYWNVDTERCVKAEVRIPLTKFGIVHNRGEKFRGEKIVIFYEKNFGLYPYYEDYDSSRPVNGGLPQNASLALHLLKVGKQISETIRDPLFSGLAVIDFEHWRPLFEMNWDRKKVYQNQSVKLVLDKNRTISEKEAKSVAETQFNKAARRFFERTLKLARHLRPKAHWGYYHYPFCNTKGNHSEYSCSKKARVYNDKLAFIYNASNALFPSIYLNGQKSAEDAFRFIQAILTETKRIAREQESQLQFYMYTKFEYDPYNSPGYFYNESDICNTIKQSADLGANGVVLWSTSNDMTHRCHGIADFIEKYLGPEVRNVIRNMNDCRTKKCAGRGNCVLQQQHIKQCSLKFDMRDYKCEHCESWSKKTVTYFV